jgi:hypothetical protein
MKATHETREREMKHDLSFRSDLKIFIIFILMLQFLSFNLYECALREHNTYHQPYSVVIELIILPTTHARCKLLLLLNFLFTSIASPNPSSVAPSLSVVMSLTLNVYALVILMYIVELRSIPFASVFTMGEECVTTKWLENIHVVSTFIYV